MNLKRKIKYKENGDCHVVKKESNDSQGYLWGVF